MIQHSALLEVLLATWLAQRAAAADCRLGRRCSRRGLESGEPLLAWAQGGTAAWGRGARTQVWPPHLGSDPLLTTAWAYDPEYEKENQLERREEKAR